MDLLNKLRVTKEKLAKIQTKIEGSKKNLEQYQKNAKGFEEQVLIRIKDIEEKAKANGEKAKLVNEGLQTLFHEEYKTTVEIELFENWISAGDPFAETTITDMFPPVTEDIVMQDEKV